MMLTRKQRWRRVHHQRSFMEPPPLPEMPCVNDDRCTGATRPRPPCRPHPIDALSLGDSLLQVVRNPSPSSSLSSSPASPSPCPPRPVDEAPPTKSVCFHHQVRVILVPCRRELRALQLQLWWGAEDYHHFRREYVQLLKMAAERHHQEAMQNRRAPPSPPPASAQPTPVTATPAAASPSLMELTAVEGEKAAAAEQESKMLPDRASTSPGITPPPSCVVKVSEISPKAAAVKAIESSGGAAQGEGEMGCAGNETIRARATAPEVVLVASSISPEALSAAAAVAVATAVPEASKKQERIDDWVKPTKVRSARGREASRSSTKWTPCAGATAAAAAAAEAEFEDYRTSSMSSVSEGYFGDDRDSVEDDDVASAASDESEDEGRDVVSCEEAAAEGATAKDQQLFGSCPRHHERPCTAKGRV